MVARSTHTRVLETGKCAACDHLQISASKSAWLVDRADNIERHPTELFVAESHNESKSLTMPEKMVPRLLSISAKLR